VNVVAGRRQACRQRPLSRHQTGQIRTTLRSQSAVPVQSQISAGQHAAATVTRDDALQPL